MGKTHSKRWTRDGDQHVFVGSLGEYRITEWASVQGWSHFVVQAKLKSARRPKTIGEMSSLKTAKEWAEQYDGYRAA